LNKERATSGDNPHELIRYETVKEQPWGFSDPNTDFDEYVLKKGGVF
jgi:hypothetical protein